MLKKGYIFLFLQLRSRIKFVFDSTRYAYCAESVFSILKYEYLGKNETKFENIWTHWSVAQAGLNYEKTRGENLVGLSL